MNKSDILVIALRRVGLRATAGRVALLKELKKNKKSLSVEILIKRLNGQLDQSNVYRALEQLVCARLVRRVDVGHQHIHYELILSERHQHQFVCASCGISEQK